MKHKKAYSVICLLLLILLFSGCRSFLYPYDRPYVIKSTTDPVAKITAYSEIGYGTLMDISENNTTLLALNTSDTFPTTYTIELFSFENQKWHATNLFTSEKEIYDALLSEKDQGLYYIEAIGSNSNSKVSKQLVWTTMDGSTSRVLTDQDESVISDLFAIPTGGIIYANNRQEIVMAYADHTRKSFIISEDYQVKNIIYDQKNQQILFLSSYKEDPTINLYRAEIKGKELIPSLSANNVTTFDYDPLSDALFFLQLNGDEKKLCQILLEKNTITTLGTGRYEKITAGGEDHTLIYSLSEENEAKSMETIRVFSESNKTSSQVTSPKALIGKLFIKNQHLYYTDITNDTPTIYSMILEKEEEP